MELREYLRVVINGWWIILPLMFLSLTVALIFSYSQTPTYEATATFVTSLSQSTSQDADTFVYAIDTLTGRARIPVTYCSILTSGAVREEALAIVGIDPVQVDVSKYEVTCANLPETNILFLAVQGSSPKLVMALTEAIGIAGTKRANELYSYYPIVLLDKPFMEPEPISPKIPQNMVLGTALGLVVGVLTAFMLEYLRSPMEQLSQQSIRHVQLGVFIERYFRERVEQELARAHLNNRPIVIGLFRLHPDAEFSLFPEEVQFKLFRIALHSVQDSLDSSDLLALVKPKIFGLLLPDAGSHEVERKITSIQNHLRTNTFKADGYVSSFTMTIGLISGGTEEETFKGVMEKAESALNIAEDSGKPLYFIRSAPPPFLGAKSPKLLPQADKGSENGEYDAEVIDLGEETIPLPPRENLNIFGSKSSQKDDDETIPTRPPYTSGENDTPFGSWFAPEEEKPYQSTTLWD